MNLAITPKITLNNFRGSNFVPKKSNEQKDTNPISRKGEAANLVKATFIAGLGLGAKILFELLDGDFLFNYIGDTASDIVDKRQIVDPAKRILCKIGGTFGLLTAAVGIFATAYTLFKSPNIVYESKVNTFKNKNEMDVFIKTNEAKKGIYDKINTQAQDADEARRDELKELFAKMQMAKSY